MEKNDNILEDIQEAFLALTESFLEQGVSLVDLKSASVRNNAKNKRSHILHHVCSKKVLLALLTPIFCSILFKYLCIDIIRSIRGTRCLIPNNYFIWEFTRPISNCDYCQNVTSALTLPNLTREEFEQYAYSSRPMVIKHAASHWPAAKVFSWKFFKDLYENIDGAYDSVDECQFLHFKSNLTNLRDVFAMSEERAIQHNGQDPWYVGWKNCHLQILDIMKQYYNLPHFLPEDAEIPYSNYIFLGYEEGAIMHLDYISRLMWQGQIIGNKTWSVAPTPECDNVCVPFNFTVYAGDIVLLDTRIWYHSTYVKGGNFSLTVTSEYG
ncbi:hypothetical protein WN48_00740 [Eufriesea mexicana]|uniref:Uncharacterized protein n=1 Tax=Eufriesea mexicana TaxID=516756 RepID=A0A310S8H2_9HYME|nr:PREDICTED: uncharacterized protein LOC108553608 [Eufriesea mexicana]OAD52581.1 hypothetical protein WN48_00740 [Eufriesea mexicana]